MNILILIFILLGISWVLIGWLIFKVNSNSHYISRNQSHIIWVQEKMVEFIKLRY